MIGENSWMISALLQGRAMVTNKPRKNVEKKMSFVVKRINVFISFFLLLFDVFDWLIH